MCGGGGGGEKRDIDKTLVGKVLRFVPGGLEAGGSSEESCFCFPRPPPTLFVCVRWRRGAESWHHFKPCLEKEKDTICFHTLPPWPQLGPCYFWKDPNAGLR